MDNNPVVVDGQFIFEGDIVLTEKQWRSVKERKGLASSSYRWPEGSDGFPLVPYVFDTDGKNLKLEIKMLPIPIRNWKTWSENKSGAKMAGLCLKQI